MLLIFRFLKGYLRVLFKCNAEKVLNLTAQNGITLWDTKLLKNGIEGYISVRDFKKLAYLKRPKGFKVHILRRYGLPFKIKSNKRKVRLLFCLGVFFGTLMFFSQFIWSVEIVGNKTTPDKVIFDALAEIGISEGVLKSKINPKINREQLLLKTDTLSWCSLNIEGSRLTVNVSEIKEEKHSDTPVNLVADFDGIIRKINITSGNCLVKVGDTVAKGDILVSSIKETADSTKFVTASGEIIAEITTEFTKEDKFLQRYTQPQGQPKRKRVLEIFTLKIPLYLGKEVYDYESTSTVKDATLFGQKLPIKIYEKEFIPLKNFEKTLNEPELEAKLKSDLERELSAKGIKDYKIIESSTRKIDQGLQLKTLIKAQINIASAKEIHISSE